MKTEYIKPSVRTYNMDTLCIVLAGSGPSSTTTDVNLGEGGDAASEMSGDAKGNDFDEFE